jgi:hypothetical protein
MLAIVFAGNTWLQWSLDGILCGFPEKRLPTAGLTSFRCGAARPCHVYRREDLTPSGPVVRSA